MPEAKWNVWGRGDVRTTGRRGGIIAEAASLINGYLRELPPETTLRSIRRIKQKLHLETNMVATSSFTVAFRRALLGAEWVLDGRIIVITQVLVSRKELGNIGLTLFDRISISRQ